jgi:hypothetical protein
LIARSDPQPFGCEGAVPRDDTLFLRLGYSTDQDGLWQPARRYAQLGLPSDPRTTLTGQPAELEAIPECTVGIRPGQPQVFSSGIRKHDAAGVEFIQQLAQFRVGE